VDTPFGWGTCNFDLMITELREKGTPTNLATAQIVYNQTSAVVSISGRLNGIGTRNLDCRGKNLPCPVIDLNRRRADCQKTSPERHQKEKGIHVATGLVF